MTTSSGPIDAAALLDDSLEHAVTIAAPTAWPGRGCSMSSPQPFTARAFSLGSRGRIPVGRILASDDGVTSAHHRRLPGPQGYHGALGPHVRVSRGDARSSSASSLTALGLTPAAVIHGGTGRCPLPSMSLSEAIFYSDARVNRWEDKGAFGSLMDVYDVVPHAGGPSRG